MEAGTTLHVSKIEEDDRYTTGRGRTVSMGVLVTAHSTHGWDLTFPTTVAEAPKVGGRVKVVVTDVIE